MIDELPGDLFQWMRGFYYVAKQGSVTNAAEVMGRQQPTISRQIKCFEKELGVMLFDRSSGKMSLTPEGQIVKKKVLSIFEDITELRNEFGDSGKTYRGEIVISATHTIMDSFLPKYVVNFTAAHPEVSFHLNEAHSEVVIERVESGEADLGISFINTLPNTVVPYPLFKTRTILIAPKDHSFFTGDSPTLEQISKCPLILFSRSGTIEKYIKNRFAEDQLAVNVVLTHNSVEAIKKYIRRGIGATIAVSNVLSKDEHDDFQITSLDKYFPERTYYMFLRRKKYRSRALEAFIHTIKPDIDLFS